jgi:BASS family bile acid:Na+ symporter
VQTLIALTTPVLAFALMLAVGLDLTPQDFARVRRQPMLLAVGLVAPLIVLPLLAAGLILILVPPPDVATGLLLIALCPIGGISNSFSYLARASTALSVSLTGLSCLVAGVTIPLLVPMFLTADQAADLAQPTVALASQLVLLLALPVVVGMWLRWLRGDLIQRQRRTLERLVFLGVALVLALMVLDEPHAFLATFVSAVPIAAAFIVGSVAAGWILAAAASANSEDRFTIAAEFGSRNLGAFLAIAVTVLGRLEFARFAYAYFVVEVPLLLLAVAAFRSARKQAALRVD